MLTRTTILCLVLSLCAAPWSRVHAAPALLPVHAPGAERPAADPNESIAAAIARLPRSVELIVIVNDARLTMDSPVGLSTWSIVSDLRSDNAVSVRKSWNEFAGQIGWTKPETLDRLFGSRLTLVMRDVESEADRRWAVASAVTEQTDRQLKSRLPLGRRNIVEGHPILSVEQGAYELTSHLAAAAGGPAAADARTVSLLLAPADRTELFDELIGMFSRRAPDPIANTEVPGEIEKLGRADIFLALRLDSEDPARREPNQAWRNFLLIAARRTPGGWECSLVLRDQEYQDQLACVPETSDAPLRALTKDALLAVLETRLKSIKDNPANPIERVFSMLGLTRPIQDLLSGRQLFSIRTAGNGELPATPLPPNAAADVHLSVTIGAETTDVQALAPLGDSFMEDCVRLLEERFGRPNPGPRPDMNLAGNFPGAVRGTDLDVPAGHPLARFFTTPLHMEWNFAPAVPSKPLRTGPAVTERGAAGPAREATPGWWLVNVGSPGALAPVSTVLRDPNREGERRHWYSLGLIRPAACVPFLRSFLPDQNGIQAALGRIERVQWRLAVSADRDIEGTMSVEMTNPK